jgi:putative toxin-antitoxin system antitoxin component (TIGR02293 family)
MAVEVQSSSRAKDFHLILWSESTTEAQLRSAFKSKWNWVVASPENRGARYSVILGNLASHYLSPVEPEIEIVREALLKGLHKSAFDRLKTLLSISGEELSEVVNIPTRTLARRSTLKPEESERVLRVATTFQRAIEVLGNLNKARRWFSSPKKALGEKTPLEFCNTEPGAQEVINLLGRIEHGVFS